MAKTKSVSIIVSVKDRFTAGFKKFNEATKASERETQRLENRIKSFGKNAQNSFTSFASGAMKTVGALGATLAGLGVKTGFTEAMNLEGYKLQLETATKDTEKAANIMRDAIDMANKTPFEGGELVQAAAMFESMGMAAKKWLPLTGDMAAATNKDFQQATEALIDAQTGELERLKEFGITKAMITEQANKMFADQQVVNNQGQIVDQEKFNEALIALMQDKYTGGMEKQAQSLRGIWSTVTGVTKSALSSIMGMTADGSIRTGSAMDRIKNKIQEVAERFEKWQTDGTIDRWAEAFDTGLSNVLQVAVPMFTALGNAVKFVADHFNVIAPLATGLFIAFKSFSIISQVTQLFTLLRVAVQMVNLTFMTSPLFWIPAAIGAIIAILNALGVDWSAVFSTIFSWIQNVWDKFTGFWDWLTARAIPGWIDSFGDKLQGLWGKVQDLWDKFKGFWSWLAGLVLPDWLTSLGSTISSAFSAASRKYATGTSYFPGGMATINEGGRGETVILPSGTQIIPHDVSKRQAASTAGDSINVMVQIQGNVIGNSDFANYVGQVVSRQILRAKRNR